MNTPSPDTAAAPRARFPFWELTPEEQAEFEDICEFQAERSAILEFDAGHTREEADKEAERLALERFPPSDAARAKILERADAMAAHYGFPAWNAARRLDDERLRRLHVNPAHWLALRDYFEKARAGREKERRAAA